MQPFNLPACLGLSAWTIFNIRHHNHTFPPTHIAQCLWHSLMCRILKTFWLCFLNLHRSCKVDIVLLAGYLKLIPTELVRAYPKSKFSSFTPFKIFPVLYFLCTDFPLPFVKTLGCLTIILGRMGHMKLGMMFKFG